MKAKGYEIKDFWDNYWPKYLGDDYYYEQEDGAIDADIQDLDTGEFLIKDDKTYNLNDFGTICYQGNDKDLEGYEWEFEWFFKTYKKSLKKNNMLNILVSLPIEDKEQLVEFIKQHGNWRII